MADLTRQPSTEAAPPHADGSGPLRLRPAGRGVRVPQLVVALLLVGVGALVSVVLYTQASAREPVLATADALARGQVVAAEDLRTIYVGSDEPFLSLPPGELSTLAGQVALTDLEAGTIVTGGVFAERDAVGEGEGIVGVSLPPGAYPTVQLAPGDRVDIVDTEAGEGVVTERAVVFDVVELGAQGQRLISLRLPAEDAVQVASVPEDRLRLVLVPETGR